MLLSGERVSIHVGTICTLSCPGAPFDAERSRVLAVESLKRSSSEASAQNQKQKLWKVELLGEKWQGKCALVPEDSLSRSFFCVLPMSCKDAPPCALS